MTKGVDLSAMAISSCSAFIFSTNPARVVVCIIFRFRPLLLLLLLLLFILLSFNNNKVVVVENDDFVVIVFSALLVLEEERVSVNEWDRVVVVVADSVVAKVNIFLLI